MRKSRPRKSFVKMIQTQKRKRERYSLVANSRDVATIAGNLGINLSNAIRRKTTKKTRSRVKVTTTDLMANVIFVENSDIRRPNVGKNMGNQVIRRKPVMTMPIKPSTRITMKILKTKKIY